MMNYAVHRCPDCHGLFQRLSCFNCAAKKERAAIVAWLHEWAAGEYRLVLKALTEAADAIERGEHREG